MFEHALADRMHQLHSESAFSILAHANALEAMKMCQITVK